VRIGLVGLGRIGAFHADTLAGLDRVGELVVTDADPNAAEAVAARLGDTVGVTTVPTAAEVLASGVDGVVIASPTASHLELLDAALRVGVPAFCEKPVAADPVAAEHLVPLVQASGVPVQIGFQRRFDPAFRRAKADLDAGVLGRLTTVRSTTLDPAPPSPAYIAGSGGIFRDCSIHDLDTVRWVTGREVVEVYATGTNAGEAFFRDVGDVDTASILLTFDDGTLGVISNTRYNGRGYDARLELHGSLDAVAAGLDESLPLRSADPTVTFPSRPPHRFFMDRFAAAFRAELAGFLDAVVGAPSPCTLADGLEASWLAEACALSFHEHRPVPRAEVAAAAGG
jgi:myo-inositol 2-dehydrogenase / D-chiro-inositol 1-dehydrogenase